MKKPEQESGRVYFTIAGVSALLCFAFLLTSSFWLTLAIMSLGSLHLARHFPHIEEFIAADPLLVWLRRISPLIVVGIFALVFLINQYK